MIGKKAKTIYLHLGTYKTATTFLQHVLFNNFYDPAGPVYYPRIGTHGPAHHYLATDEFPRWSNGVSDDEYAKVWNELLSDIVQKKAPAVLLSSEMFCSLDLDRIHYIHEKLSDFRVRAIIYLRRQDQYISSLAAQLIKGCHGKPENYSDLAKAIDFVSTSNRFDYKNMCANWAHVIGKENLIVRPFEQEQLYKSDILADFFCHFLKVSMPPSIKLPSKHINPRLCRDALEFKSLVNRIPLNRDEKNATLPGLLTYSQSKEHSTRSYHQEHDLLPPSQRLEIFRRFSDDNTTIARTYLGREDGILFSEPFSGSTAEWKPYPGLNSETLKEIVHTLSETCPDVVERLSPYLTTPVRDNFKRPYNMESSSFKPVSSNDFFTAIKNHTLPSLDKVVSELPNGILSKEGELGLFKFRIRIAQYWSAYVKAWSNACNATSFSNFSNPLRFFLNQIRSDDLVDEEYPIFQGYGSTRNCFCDVRILKTLSVICAGELMAPYFLLLLAREAPAEPLIYLYFTALSQFLLERGEFRHAADFALKAGRARSHELCISKTIVSTQRALFSNGMKPDIHQVCIDNKDLFCEMPFTVFNIFQRQTDQPISFFLCKCGWWTKAIFNSDFSWNGYEAQEFRHSILDGSFRYCDELACPFLMRNRLPKRKDLHDSYFRKIIDNNTVILENGPIEILLNYDRSCNLSCPSCRETVFFEDKETIEYYDKTMDAVLPPLLSNAKILDLSQAGEALASPHFRRLLKSLGPAKYPDLKITLLTNLKLVSEKTWRELGDTAGSIKTLRLSIDGATPQTLEKLRRGLKWGRMLDALAFIRDLRKSSKLDYVPVNFIIQKDNFRELPMMLELCSSYCIDILQAARICGHGSYTDDQFKDIDVGDPAHPLYAEYIQSIRQTLDLHKKMKQNAAEIIALGQSVPDFSHPAL